MKNLLLEAKIKTSGVKTPNQVAENEQTGNNPIEKLAAEVQLSDHLKPEEPPTQLPIVSHNPILAQGSGSSTFDADLLTQWKVDIERVTRSLQRLQDENFVIKRPAQIQHILQNAQTDYLSRQQNLEQKSFQTNADDRRTQKKESPKLYKKLRFDTDEVYLAYLEKKDEVHPDSRRTGSQKSVQNQSAPLNQISTGSHQATPQRSDIIQKRVQEAKVNLEWKIAMKLKQKLTDQDSARMPSGIPSRNFESDCAEDRPRRVPSHIVSTHSNSNYEGGLIFGSSKTNCTFGSNIGGGINSVEQISKCSSTINKRSIDGARLYQNKNRQRSPLQRNAPLPPSRGGGYKERDFKSNDILKQISPKRQKSPAQNDPQDPCQQQVITKPIKIISRGARPASSGVSEKEDKRQKTPLKRDVTPLKIPHKKIIIVKNQFKPTSAAANSKKENALLSPAASSRQTTTRNSILHQSKSPCRHSTIFQPRCEGQTEHSSRRSCSVSKKPGVPVQETTRKSRPMLSRSGHVSQGHSRNCSNVQNGPQKLIAKSYNKQQDQLCVPEQKMRQPSLSITPKSSRTPKNQHPIKAQGVLPASCRPSSSNRQSVRHGSPNRASANGNQISPEQQNQQDNWIRNCDRKIMRFIATSPSKLLKYKLACVGCNVSDHSGVRQSSNSQREEPQIIISTNMQMVPQRGFVEEQPQLLISE